MNYITKYVGVIAIMTAVTLGYYSAARSTVSANLGSDNPTGDVPPGKLDLLEFNSSPFPYYGTDPIQGKPFLDVNTNNRLGHTSLRGGVYWADETYGDRRTLLYIPSSFHIDRPGTIVVFFHGNLSTLTRDVISRLQVPRQVAESGMNAVLVAPQFAVNALDSSAGHFSEPGAFQRYLEEASTRLAKLYGADETSDLFNAMRVVLVAYSGGYLPAVFAMDVGGADKRVAGVILLDSLYGQVDTFANWITHHLSTSFFFSAYSKSSEDYNMALQDLLTKKGVAVGSDVPVALRSGSVSFLRVSDDVVHDDFVSTAWTADPLKNLLSKVPDARIVVEQHVTPNATDRIATNADVNATDGASSRKAPSPASVIVAGQEVAAGEPQESQASPGSHFGVYLVVIGITGIVLTLIFTFAFGLIGSHRRR